MKIYAIEFVENIDQMTDDAFIYEANKCGLVWNFDEFQEAFNAGFISDELYIKFL